ncbi:MAG: lipopolysaccharide core heptose(II) kinase RfaY, partial [Fusobacterium sp.]|uniref:lipopolysaccharide core heptose(II) kinase RfaY n=1 Tax=Fusobacterium sp. TaxID=68766 RepID=UPI0026DD9E4F
MLIKEYYKNCAIYSYEKEYTELAKKILDNDYSLVKELKNTKRNYVSLIKVNNQNYIYKEARNEYIIPQRKLMTIFKNGEALETLKNVNSLIQYGFTEYIKPLIAVNKRKKGMINFSFLVMEYIEGKEDREQIDRILEKMKEIHKKGYYHGDFNPSNFLFSKENKLYILDTQCKKMLFGTYISHYDMLN